MEYDFENLCCELAQMFVRLGEEYSKNRAFQENKIDRLEKEVHKNNEIKRRILEALREDLDD